MTESGKRIFEKVGPMLTSRGLPADILQTFAFSQMCETIALLIHENEEATDAIALMTLVYSALAKVAAEENLDIESTSAIQVLYVNLYIIAAALGKEEHYTLLQRIADRLSLFRYPFSSFDAGKVNHGGFARGAGFGDFGKHRPFGTGQKFREFEFLFEPPRRHNLIIRALLHLLLDDFLDDLL